MGFPQVFRYELWPEGFDPDNFNPETDESPIKTAIENGYTAYADLPEGCRIQGVFFTTRGVSLSAIVDPDATEQKRRFFVCGNGIALPFVGPDDALDGYVGTAKLGPGSPTLHVYETTQHAELPEHETATTEED